jgi:hypothetical protein
MKERKDKMLSLGRVNRALDFVRTGKVSVNEAALNRLLSIFVDVHSTEFFNELDLELIQAIEISGNEHGSTYCRRETKGSHRVLH